MVLVPTVRALRYRGSFVQNNAYLQRRISQRPDPGPQRYVSEGQPPREANTCGHSYRDGRPSLVARFFWGSEGKRADIFRGAPGSRTGRLARRAGRLELWREL